MSEEINNSIDVTYCHSDDEDDEVIDTIFNGVEEIQTSFNNETTHLLTIAVADIDKTLTNSLRDIHNKYLQIFPHEELLDSIESPTSYESNQNLILKDIDKIKKNILKNVTDIIDLRFASSRASLLYHKNKISTKLEMVRTFMKEERRIYNLSSRNREKESIRLHQDRIIKEHNLALEKIKDENKKLFSENALKIVHERTLIFQNEIVSLKKTIKDLEESLEAAENVKRTVNDINSTKKTKRNTGTTNINNNNPNNNTTSGASNFRSSTSSHKSSINILTKSETNLKKYTKPSELEDSRSTSNTPSIASSDGKHTNVTTNYCSNCIQLEAKLQLLESILRSYQHNGDESSSNNNSINNYFEKAHGHVDTLPYSRRSLIQQQPQQHQHQQHTKDQSRTRDSNDHNNNNIDVSKKNAIDISHSAVVATTATTGGNTFVRERRVSASGQPSEPSLSLDSPVRRVSQNRHPQPTSNTTNPHDGGGGAGAVNTSISNKSGRSQPNKGLRKKKRGSHDSSNRVGSEDDLQQYLATNSLEKQSGLLSNSSSSPSPVKSSRVDEIPSSSSLSPPKTLIRENNGGEEEDTGSDGGGSGALPEEDIERFSPLPQSYLLSDEEMSVPGNEVMTVDSDLSSANTNHSEHHHHPSRNPPSELGLTSRLVTQPLQIPKYHINNDAVEYDPSNHSRIEMTDSSRRGSPPDSRPYTQPPTTSSTNYSPSAPSNGGGELDGMSLDLESVNNMEVVLGGGGNDDDGVTGPRSRNYSLSSTISREIELAKKARDNSLPNSYSYSSSIKRKDRDRANNNNSKNLQINIESLKRNPNNNNNGSMGGGAGGRNRGEDSNNPHYLGLFTEAIAAQQELQEALVAVDKIRSQLAHRVKILEEEAVERELLNDLKIKERGILLRGMAQEMKCLREKIAALESGGVLTRPCRAVTATTTGKLNKNLELPLFKLDLNTGAEEVVCISPERQQQQQQQQQLPHLYFGHPLTASALIDQTRRGQSISNQLLQSQSLHTLPRPKTTSATTVATTMLPPARTAGGLVSPSLHQQQQQQYYSSIQRPNSDSKANGGVVGVGQATWPGQQPIMDDDESPTSDLSAFPQFLMEPVQERDVLGMSTFLESDSLKELKSIRRKIGGILSAQEQRKIKRQPVNKNPKDMIRKEFR